MVQAANKVSLLSLINRSRKGIHHDHRHSLDAGVQKIVLRIQFFEGTCYIAEFFPDQL